MKIKKIYISVLNLVCGLAQFCLWTPIWFIHLNNTMGGNYDGEKLRYSSKIQNGLRLFLREISTNNISWIFQKFHLNKNAPSDKISPHCVPKCISLRKNLEILSQLLSKTFQNFTKKYHYALWNHQNYWKLYVDFS